jgi:hypothetical protein
MLDRERLIARVRSLGVHGVRTAADSDAAVSPQDAARLAATEARVAHLERLAEALQDSVHREATRQGKRITDLEAGIQPAALSAALSQAARERGL